MMNKMEVVKKPWGKYQNVYEKENFIVKILTIFPKSKISLQYHQKRSEHWVVTHGIANVTKGDKTFILKPNESTYIGVKEIHRIENKEDIDLVIVEVQFGSEISENDIVRLDDIYGRGPNTK